MTSSYYEVTPLGIRAIHPDQQQRTQTYATLAAARSARGATTKPHYKYDPVIHAGAAARRDYLQNRGITADVAAAEVRRATASAYRNYQPQRATR